MKQANGKHQQVVRTLCIDLEHTIHEFIHELRLQILSKDRSLLWGLDACCVNSGGGGEGRGGAKG